MATLTFTSTVATGHIWLHNPGYLVDVTKDGNYPAAGYRITSAVLICEIRNAYGGTVEVYGNDETLLGEFGIAGAGTHYCHLDLNYDYANLTKVRLKLKAGSAGAQLHSSTTVRIQTTWQYTRSELTVTPSYLQAGNDVAVNFTVYRPTATHVLSIAFGHHIFYREYAAGQATDTITIPLDWLDAIPNSRSGFAVATLSTYLDGVDLGSVVRNIEIAAPASTAPQFTPQCSPLLTVDGVTYPSIGAGKYVQYKGGVTATFANAQAAYGATITQYWVEGGGYTGMASPYNTGIIRQNGAVTFTFIATDSRGLSATKTLDINVLPYSPPSITNFRAWRTDATGVMNGAGNNGKVLSSWTFNSLQGGNTCSAVAYITLPNGEQQLTAAMASGVEYPVATASGAVNLSTELRYPLRLVVTDIYGSVSTSSVIPAATYSMHWNSTGTSFGFGTACQYQDAVEISGDRTLYLGDQTLADIIRTTVIDLVYPVGALYCSTQAESPAGKFGGNWEQIKDRFLLAAGDNYAAGSEGGAATHTLTESEMPYHRHNTSVSWTNASTVNTISFGGNIANISAANSPLGVDRTDSYTRYTGNGHAHNNMPPYYTLYIWKRIS